MAEDLRTSRYRDGSSIGSNLIYDWYAVNSTRKLAPEGWHIPTVDDWNILVKYLGGWSIEANTGLSLMEEGALHWLEKGASTNNSSGFTALPINSDGLLALYWSATENEDDYNKANAFYIENGYLHLSDYPEKSLALSVRCVKD